MKQLLLSFVALASLMFVPSLALQGNAAAVDVFGPCTSSAARNSAVCKDVKAQSGSDVNPIIRDIKIVILVLSYIVGVACVIIIIVSGIRMILANGDAQVIAKARSGVMYALIGLVIASFAQVIVAFVIDKL